MSEVLVPESSEVVVLPLEVARIENFPIDFTVRYYFHKVTVPPLQSWTPLQVLVNGARPINGGELSDTFMAYSADEISLHYEASIA